MDKKDTVQTGGPGGPVGRKKAGEVLNEAAQDTF
jgi:hypothetical protein